MATMMTANVFFIIMPNQRKSVAALIAGQTPDARMVKPSNQRSTHNNYITLPVLFMMLSNHYPVTYSNASVIPALVTLVIVTGALVRYFYNMWHGDHDRRLRGGRGSPPLLRSGWRSGCAWRRLRACAPVIGLGLALPAVIGRRTRLER